MARQLNTFKFFWCILLLWNSPVNGQESQVSELIDQSNQLIEVDLDSSLALARQAHRQTLTSTDAISAQRASLCLIAALVESYKFSEAIVYIKALNEQLSPGVEGYPELLYWKSKMALKSPDYIKAAQLAHRGLKSLELTNERSLELKSRYLGLLGLAYTHRGLFDSSEFFFGEQLALAAEQGFSKAAALLDYASYMMARGETIQALDCCLKSIELSDKNSLIHQKARGLKIALEYSGVITDSQATEEAKHATLMACRIESMALIADFKKRGWHKNAAISQDLVAQTFLAQGLSDSATTYYKKAQKSFALVGDTARMAVTQIHLGQVFENNKMWDSAAACFVTAHLLAKKAQIWPIAGNASYNASLMYEQMDSMLLALNWLHENLWIRNEKVFNLEREKAVQKYRSLYGAEENKRKAQEAINDKQNLQNQRNLILAISIGLSIVLLASIVLLRNYYVSLRDKKRIHQLEMEELVRTKDEQREGARLEGQDTERKKIAQDLHDELGGTLSMIQMHLSGLSEKVDSFKEQEKRQYDTANLLLEKALEQVRNIARDMMSGTLSKFGLMAAFHDLADVVNESQQLHFKLVGNNLKKTLLNSYELGIFRVVQELTSNTLKHAHASEIRLELIEHENELSINYEDNGIGFDDSDTQKTKGIGLKNIQSRIAQMNGRLHLETTAGKGVLFIIEIPYGEGHDKSSDS